MVVNVYIVIIGGGRLGLHIALDLVADEKDVTIIEKDEERCKFVATQIDNQGNMW